MRRVLFVMLATRLRYYKVQKNNYRGSYWSLHLQQAPSGRRKARERMYWLPRAISLRAILSSQEHCIQLNHTSLWPLRMRMRDLVFLNLNTLNHVYGILRTLSAELIFMLNIMPCSYYAYFPNYNVLILC